MGNHCWNWSILFTVCLLASCAKEVALPIQADFAVEVVDNDYSVPVRVRINNQTEGADTYQWTFEGGKPADSFDKNPGPVVFETSGEHRIHLRASNRDGSEESKETVLSLVDPVEVDFTVHFEGNGFSPVVVALENTSTGAINYSWHFEGGIPSYSKAKTPGKVVFSSIGEHRITLEASNERETRQLSKTIVVEQELVPDFVLVPAFQDDDFEAPVILNIVNNSLGATEYVWSCLGAEPAESILENPTFLLPVAGLYTIKLTATNGKTIITTAKTVEVFPNTNLRTIKDVKLGINSAHDANTLGSFYSTLERKDYVKDSVPLNDGSIIDIAFFGLDPEFNFNKFVSPDKVQDYTFDPLTNATHTKFINLQESCECQASLSVLEFDAMKDDSLLEPMLIEETIGGIQDFDSTVVPRIVLFETSDGRKGAIKVKEFVKDGTNSHIVVDIKVQKQ